MSTLKEQFLAEASPINDWEQKFFGSIKRWNSAPSAKQAKIMRKMLDRTRANKKAATLDNDEGFKADWKAAHEELDKAYSALHNLNDLGNNCPEILYQDGERSPEQVREMFAHAEERFATATQRVEKLRAKYDHLPF